MEATGTRQVILAGIGESRLDLFLLLNEGAGYEVAGVVEAEGNGESSRIAEILGVRVFREHETQSLPQADLLIYGEPKYRTLGDELGLPPEKVWGEEQAWRILTEDGESAGGDEAEEQEVPASDTMMMSTENLDLPTSTPDLESATDSFEAPLDLPPLPSTGEGASAFDFDGPDSGPSLDAPSGPAHEEESVSASFDPAPAPSDSEFETPSESSTIEMVRPEGVASIEDASADSDDMDDGAAGDGARQLDESLLKSPEALNVLEAFSEATKSVDSIYDWTLARAVAITRSYAGGVRPIEPVRLPVWHDRRSAASGEIPKFLKRDSDEKNLMTVPVGDAGEAGSAELVLVGARQPDKAAVKALIRSIAPALRTVAELEDLRRERECDGMTRRLADALRDTDSPEEALADSCRELAELFDAREAVLLFENTAGVEYRGFSSKGSPFFAPIGSGLFGKESGGDKPRRFLDEEGEWHYRVPFSHDGHQGVLGLFGVRAEAGAVEAVGHQASALADALARHFPDEVFSS